MGAQLFLDFYRMTMERQGMETDQIRLDEMKSIITALCKNNLGRMFGSFTSDEELGSMAFFGMDNKRAYYLFGANDPKLRDTQTGTAVLWDTFKMLNQSGFDEVDMEGVNSPDRGWFKLSFGGDLRQYYRITFDKFRSQ